MGETGAGVYRRCVARYLCGTWTNYAQRAASCRSPQTLVTPAGFEPATPRLGNWQPRMCPLVRRGYWRAGAPKTRQISRVKIGDLDSTIHNEFGFNRCRPTAIFPPSSLK